MPKYRRNRINDAVARETADIIRDVKDPRVSAFMLTVTGADVTADLKYAKIFYSFLDESITPEEEKELRRGLKSAAPFVRRELAVRLNLRITPELNFVRDTGVSHGAHIASLLHGIEMSKAEVKEGAEESEDEE